MTSRRLSRGGKRPLRILGIGRMALLGLMVISLFATLTPAVAAPARKAAAGTQSPAPPASAGTVDASASAFCNRVEVTATWTGKPSKLAFSLTAQGGRPPARGSTRVFVPRTFDKAAGSYTHTFTNVPLGTYEAAVQATFGRKVQKDSVRDLRVECTPPVVTITSGPAELTRERSAAFAFEANEEPVTWTCRLDNAKVEPCDTGTASYENLADGEHTFEVAATDLAKNAASAQWHWRVDETAPKVSIDAHPGEVTTDTDATFEFSADEEAAFACALDDLELAPCSSPRLYTDLDLGNHTFTLRATDPLGNTGEAAWSWTIQPDDVRAVDDGSPATPAIVTDEDTASAVFDVLANDDNVNDREVSLAVESAPAHGTAECVLPEGCTYTPDADFDGPDMFSYTVADEGTSSTANVYVSVTAVADPPVATDDEAELTLDESDLTDDSVTVNVLANDRDVDGDPLAVTAVEAPAQGTAIANPDGTIKFTAARNFDGLDTFAYTVCDGPPGADPKCDLAQVTVNAAPGAALSTNDLAIARAPLSVTFDASASQDVGGNIVAYEWEFPGADGLQTMSTPPPMFSGTPTASARWSVPGTHTVRLTVVDDRGARGTTEAAVTVVPEQETTTVSTVYESTKFLQDRQGGLKPEAIRRDTAAVISGTVRDTDGDPLPGVAIGVRNHPEYGEVTTDAAGRYFLVVGGGATYSLVFLREGRISATRLVHTTPNGWVPPVDDVVLVPYGPRMAGLDGQDALIKADSEDVQVAVAPEIRDGDGSRRSVLLVPAHTTMKTFGPSDDDPDSMTKPVADLWETHLRWTEATVGARGEQRMALPLPPTSDYTYAGTFTSDEADSLRTVFANSSGLPVVNYVEVTNFLTFPPGSRVPVGVGDDRGDTWEPSRDGIVVEYLGRDESGIAQLNVDDDPEADNDDLESVLGYTPQLASHLEDELQALADIHGDQRALLWRVPLRHFSPVDYNWSAGLFSSPPGPGPEDDCGCLCDCFIDGYSRVNVLKQTLGEDIPLAGTGETLHYESDRVPGNRAAYAHDVRLRSAEAQIPEWLGSVEVSVTVAGAEHTKEFTAEELASRETYTFVWDGKDAFGRVVQGRQRASVIVTYLINDEYARPADDSASFALPGDSDASTGVKTRRPVAFDISSAVWLGVYRAREAVRVGGWGLSKHHAYDPDSMALYRGDGTRRQAGEARTIDTFAGTDVNPQTMQQVVTKLKNGESLSAEEVPLVGVSGVATARDGSVFVTLPNWAMVLRIKDGTVKRVASLVQPTDVAVAPDGDALYVADAYSKQIWKVWSGSDGELGTSDDRPKLVPVLVSPQADPQGIDVDEHGYVYVADTANNRVLRVTPEATLATTLADSGDGLTGPRDLAVGADGTVYIANSGQNRIDRIDPNGRLAVHAGGGTSAEEGIAATEAALAEPSGVDLRPDNTLVISEAGAHRVRAVSPTGTITTIAGTGTAGFAGDGGAATEGTLNRPLGVALDTAGNIVVADRNNDRIRRVAPTMPGLTDGEDHIAIPDGDEVFEFDASGRHLATYDALTGTPIRQFTYDGSGLLSEVRDTTGTTVVRMVRNSDTGEVTVTGRFGETTTLKLDGNGYLDTITDPLARVTDVTHQVDGLLVGFRPPDSGGRTYTYEPDTGRLVKDEGPARDVDGVETRPSLTLNRIPAPLPGHKVDVTTPEGRTTTHRIERLPTGELRRTSTADSDAGEVATTTQQTRDGNRSETVQPDGTRLDVTYGPDSHWGMLEPETTHVKLTTPKEGTTVEITSSRERTQGSEPIRPASLVDTTRVGDRVSTTTFKSGVDPAVAGSEMTITGTSPERTQKVWLDSLGRRIRAQVDSLEPVTYTYYNSGDFIGFLDTVQQGTRGVKYTYAKAAAGKSLASTTESDLTDPTHKTVKYFDPLGRLDKVELPGGRVVDVQHDENGHDRGIVPPQRDGFEPTPHYVDLTEDGLVESEMPPVPNEGDDPSLYETQRNYDLGKLPTKIELPEDNTVTLEYGTDRQLDSLTSSRGATLFAYEPGVTTPVSTVGPQGTFEVRVTDGPLPTITGQLQLPEPPEDLDCNGDEKVTDADAVCLLTTTKPGPASGFVSWGYGDDSLMPESQTVLARHRTNPLLRELLQVGYEYDDNGRLVGVGDLDFTQGVHPTTGLFPTSTLGVVTTTSETAPDGALDDISVTAGDAEILGIAYSDEGHPRDGQGRVKRQIETIGGETKTIDYTYTAADRLESVTIDTKLVAVYADDANGNRTSVTDYTEDPNGVTTTCEYDRQDRLTSCGDTEYGNNDLGQRVTKTTADDEVTTYEWDEFGNLEGASLPDGTEITYLLDSAGRRVGKSIGGELAQGFIYEDNLRPAAELDAQGHVRSRFVYAKDANVPDYMLRWSETDQSYDTYRIITDHLGSVRQVVDAETGEIVQRRDYHAWGNITRDETASGFSQPFGFAGGLHDTDTGLTRFGAREYDPATGRWMTRDPIGFAGGDTNLYAYVGGDPVNFTDSTGLSSWSDTTRVLVTILFFVALLACAEFAALFGLTTLTGTALYATTLLVANGLMWIVDIAWGAIEEMDTFVGGPRPTYPPAPAPADSTDPLLAGHHH